MPAVSWLYGGSAGFADAPAAIPAESSVTVVWEASASAEVVGYKIYFGVIGSGVTNAVDVGNMTTATLTNLPTGSLFFLFATAYNDLGQESAGSNPVFCTPAGSPVFYSTNKLTMIKPATTSSPASLLLPMSSGKVFYLQATEDLRVWNTINITTSPPAGFLEFKDNSATNLTRRFYRLLGSQ
jgi:hypothetical protein